MKVRVVLFQTHATEGSELVVSFGIVVAACRGMSFPERYSRWGKSAWKAEEFVQRMKPEVLGPGAKA